MDIVVGTVIIYLFLGCRPLMDKIVRGAVAWNNTDQTLYSPTSLNYRIYNLLHGSLANYFAVIVCIGYC